MNRNGETQVVGRMRSMVCASVLCMRQSCFYTEMVHVHVSMQIILGKQNLTIKVWTCENHDIYAQL